MSTILTNVGGIVDQTGGAAKVFSDPNRNELLRNQKAFQAAAQAAAHIQDQVDDAKTLSRDNQAVEAFNAELNNFELLKGQEAIDGRNASKQKLETIKNDLSQDLDNNIQRQMLEKVLSRRIALASGRVDKHYAQQTSVFKAGQLKARADNLTNDAVANMQTYGMDGGAYSESKQQLETTLNEISTMGGMSPEQTKVLKKGAYTGLHTLAIKKLITDSEGQNAKDYLADNKDEINQPQFIALTNLVKEEFFKDETLNVSKEISDKFPGLNSQIVELEKRRSTNAISDELYSSVRNNLVQNHNFKKARRTEYQNSVVKTATKWLDVNRDSTMPTDMANDLKGIGKYAAMVRYQNNGRHVTDDPGVFTELINSNVLRGMDEEQFHDNFRTKLSNRDYDYANQLRTDINSGANTSQFVSTNDLIKQTATQLNIIPANGKLNDAEKRNMYDFTVAVQSLVQRNELNELGGKREATTKEISQWISDELQNTASVGGFMGFWKKEVPVISIPVDEREDATIELQTGEEISLKDLAAVQEQILAFGGDPENKETVTAVYGIMKGTRGGIIPVANGDTLFPDGVNTGKDEVIDHRVEGFKLADIDPIEVEKVRSILSEMEIPETPENIISYWTKNKGHIWD